MVHVARAALLACLALPAASTSAQTRPDFSGTWTLDATRSASAVQNEPIGPTTIVINQSATEITIETRRQDKSSTVTYRAGSADAMLNATNRANLLTSMWYWDGPKLVTESVRDINGQTVRTKEVRMLTAAGGEMTVDTLLVVEHGYSLRGAKNYGDGRDVYKRVRQP